ncbi:recombination regulator RecX [Halalkalibacter krulwichiae]|uniref:Regulatory protein RecX n=1 Tax=Halalkalibacter krulwichiae TaxID=199441 RepID=A0A1X9M6E5_9BACI|nr:recombination regulator RecX [Halalkalibacter krulwichiae]ARK29015.1 Regulatory protein RecX [Halalkalibacter krulwichiae]
MAIISKIQIQVKNKQRYNVFLDTGKGEEYALSVDEDLIIKHGLRKGMDLDEDALIELIDEDEKKKAYYLAINYLSYRMRSIEEIRTYLQKKEKEEHHIEEVILKLIKDHLLNDLEFANSYIRSKQATLMKGPIKLKQELLQKGVEETIIEQALEQYLIEDQVDIIVKWLEKQKKRSVKTSNRAFLEKLSNQLQLKGFARETIVEALKEVDLSNEEDEEWKAICFQGEKVKRKYQEKYKGWEYKQRIKQFLYRKGFSVELIERYIDDE